MSDDELKTHARSYSKSDSKMASGKKDKTDPLEENVLLGIKKPVSDGDWWEVFNKLATVLTGVQRELKDLKEIKGNASSPIINEAWKKSVDDVLKLTGKDTSEGSESSFRSKLMGNMIIKQEEQIQELKSRMDSVISKSIRPNLIIHGILEARNETYTELTEKLANFFKTQMNIEEEILILDAYRKGVKGDRPVFIQLQRPSDKSIIFSNASSLKDKKNVKKKLFSVQDDTTPQAAENRRYYRDLLKETKSMDDDDPTKFSVKMTRGSIMINNEKIKSMVSEPSFAEILRMEDKELEDIKATKLYEGDEHLEKGSEFFSFAQVVKNENDVRKGLTKLKIKFADSTHISCAYRFKNPIGAFRQGFVDGEEIGQGRNLLNAIKQKEEEEICVFVVRYYGGAHLGPRRFEIARNLINIAIRNLKIAKAGRKKRKERTQCLSQSSVFSDVESLPGEENQGRRVAEEQEIASAL